MNVDRRTFPSTRWFVAVLVPVALAGILTVLLSPQISFRAILPIYYVAIMISAWRGGLSGGLVATLLSSVLAGFLLFPPFGTFGFDRASLERLGIYLTVCFAITFLFEARNRIERRRRVADEAHRRSDERFRAAFSSAVIGFAITDLDGRFIEVNKAFQLITGYGADELREMRIGEITHSDDLPESLNRTQKLIRGERHHFVMEKRFVKKGGEVIWVQNSVSLIHDHEGHPVNLIRLIEDITERKQAEEALRHNEAILQETGRIAKVGGWEFDPATGLGTWTEEVARIYDLEPGQATNVEIGLSYYVGESRSRIEAAVKEAIESATPYDLELEIRTAKGNHKWVRTIGHPIVENGKAVRVRGSFQDVTERKQAEDQLKASTEQLRALSARLQSAREEEGTRIAREIHDELGGALTGLKWDLEGIDRVLSGSANDESTREVVAKIPAMNSMIDSTIETVRRISSELRPSVLDDLGLVSAIEWQAQQFQQRTGIPVECASSDEVSLSRERSIAVFRVFQEILTNILRHSGATLVNVQTMQDNGEFVLAVSDNGRGISEEQKADTTSLGLLGMRERVHLVGGEISITGVEGEGTTVTVRVPIG